MSKTDLQLKQDIEAELVWDPMVKAAQIGVTVYDGTVSLLGFVDTYPQKWSCLCTTRSLSNPMFRPRT